MRCFILISLRSQVFFSILNISYIQLFQMNLLGKALLSLLTFAFGIQ